LNYSRLFHNKSNDFVADSTVTLSQLRATYRFDYSWDLVTEARWIGQPSADFNEFGFVVEAGYYLTPELRLSAGYVFGKVDDSDFSGTRSAGGPYIGATFKLSDVFDSFGQPKAPVKK
jgi:hypothetical protein